jgi:hypothetical protein
MAHQRFSPDLEALERSFRGRPAVNVETFYDEHNFEGCPRLPVHDTDIRLLSKWRECKWGGSPSLQAALGTHNELLIAGYRRIWGRSPMWIQQRENEMGEQVPDWPISRTELLVIAHHLYGYPEPRMKKQIFETPDGPNF